MKVTAILPDELIEDVKEFTGGKNITESLLKALNDWLYSKRLEKLNGAIKKSPIEFISGFDAKEIRKLNTKIT